MAKKYILTHYVEEALLLAKYEKLEDGTFCGRSTANSIQTPKVADL